MHTNIILSSKVIVGTVDPTNPVDDTEDGTLLILSSTPVGLPVGGGYLYADATGNLHYKGPSGTDTQVALA